MRKLGEQCQTDGRIDMTLKDLPPRLIKMLLAIRAQILIRKKHDETAGKL